MPERWRTVRVRLTLAAVVVTTLVVVVAGLWLVHTVDDSLRARQRDQDVQRLAELRAELEQGRRPGALEVVVPGRTTYFEVRVDQRPVAATPGYEELTDDVMETTARVDTPTGLVELVAASPLEPIERSVDAVRSGLLLTFPLLVLGAGLLTWALAGRALRPVEAIRTEVESITGSTLDRRVPVPDSGDEVARLAQTMNAMLDRLQEASSRQQRFVADASHELRTPLTRMRTELEVDLAHPGTADPTATHRSVLEELDELERLVADLLALARLDATADDLREAASVDVAELVAEVVASASATVPIDLTTQAPPPVVRGDAHQVRRAFGNVVENATRHARSRVAVGITTAGGAEGADGAGWVTVVVDDDGPGIPAAERERVFERFTQLDPARSDVHNGLGLSIAREIVERHGGTTAIDDSPLGGARVLLVLPRATDA
jgi:signal transduction histidine kinase